MIAIKPHHFVDVITALGDGKTAFEPHPYGHALHLVARAILDNPEEALCIEFGADTICAPCRHNRNGLCEDTIDVSFKPQAPFSKRAYNLLLDERWAERLALKQGDRLTVRQFCERIKEDAGDIADIYRETPADRTADRQAKLMRGVDLYLVKGPARH